MKYEICHANKVIWVNWVLRWIVKEFRSIFSVVIFILNFRIYSIDYVRVCIPCSTVHRHNRIIPCVICFYSILLLNRDASIELAGTLAFVCAYFIADFLTSPNNKMYSIGISIYHTWKSVRPSILTSVVFIHFLADIPADDILELFGKTFFEFCQDSGYDKILQVLGATPRDFLQVSWLIDGLQYQQRIAWADTRSYIYIYICCRTLMPYTIIWVRCIQVCGRPPFAVPKRAMVRSYSTTTRSGRDSSTLSLALWR